MHGPARLLAASIVAATGVSVADAHLGAAVRSLPSTEIVVLSSDPADMGIVCTPASVRVVVI